MKLQLVILKFSERKNYRFTNTTECSVNLLIDEVSITVYPYISRVSSWTLKSVILFKTCIITEYGQYSYRPSLDPLLLNDQPSIADLLNI